MCLISHRELLRRQGLTRFDGRLRLLLRPLEQVGLGGSAEFRAWGVVAPRERTRTSTPRSHGARPLANGIVIARCGRRLGREPEAHGIEGRPCTLHATVSLQASIGAHRQNVPLGDHRLELRAETETQLGEQSVAADKHPRSPCCAGSLRTLPLNADVGRTEETRRGDALSARNSRHEQPWPLL